MAEISKILGFVSAALITKVVLLYYLPIKYCNFRNLLKEAKSNNTIDFIKIANG